MKNGSVSLLGDILADVAPAIGVLTLPGVG